MNEEKTPSAKENIPGGLSGEQLEGAVNAILQNPAFSRLLGEVGGSKAPPAVTPELLEKLPQMMAALSPLVSGAADASKKESSAAVPSDSEKRKKLLAALKPYLSDNRRDAVDNILRVTEMGDLLGNLHLPGREK